MSGPTERSSAPSSPVLILDQRSSLGSLTGWPACCGDFVVLARSKPASLRSRADFCSSDEMDKRFFHPETILLFGRACHSRNRRAPLAIATPLARTDETIGRPEIKNCCRRLCVRPPSPNVSCAFPILTQPCLTAWAVTKRDYGARQRKPFGRSTRCDSRRLQCGDGCAGSRPSPGIGRGRSPLTQNLGIECREDDVASAAVHWVNQ